MQNDYGFLKHFITEEIFVIDDKLSMEDTRVAEAKPEYVTTKSGTMIVLRNPEERDSDTLNKLLTAINVRDPEFSSSLDFSSNHANYLLFGIDSDIVKYQITQINRAQVLYSDSIQELDLDRNAKYQLWEELQKMFS